MIEVSTEVNRIIRQSQSSGFGKLLTDWPGLPLPASRQIRLSLLKLGQARGGRSIGIVGNRRRCPFRFLAPMPIPCLNNLDIYKQTAAGGVRVQAEIKYPGSPLRPVCLKSPSLAQLVILAFLSSPSSLVK